MKDDCKLCPLPWIGASVLGNGNFRVCSHSSTSIGKGLVKDLNGRNLNISEDNFSDSVNSKLINSIKSSMLKGEEHENCKRCYLEEKRGIESFRNKLNNIYDKNEYIKNKNGIKYLNLTIGNDCNLKCIMCSPKSSSKWYEDHVNIWGEKVFYDTGKKLEFVKKENKIELVSDPYKWIQEKNPWDKIAEIIDTLEVIYISGGEPFLSEEHFLFIERCVEEGRAASIELEYSTNATYFPKKYIPLLKKFKQVRFGISLDSIHHMNDYIRFPSEFSRIEDNLQLFDSIENSISWISLTVQNLNIYYLPEIIEWKKSNNFKRINSNPNNPLFSTHPLHDPSFLSVKALSPEIKTKVRSKLEAYVAKQDVKYKKGVEDIINPYLNLMDSEDCPDLYAKFLSYLSSIDRVRGCDHKNTFKELFDS